jgi:DNA-binding HxlR family transcriptional regulator
MVVLDHLGRRWSLRIAWELRDGPLAFRELQRRCGMASPNILTTRLTEALELGTIARNGDGLYGLTKRGRELGTILSRLDGWAKRYAKSSSRRRMKRSAH